MVSAHKTLFSISIFSISFNFCACAVVVYIFNNKNKYRNSEGFTKLIIFFTTWIYMNSRCVRTLSAAAQQKARGSPNVGKTACKLAAPTCVQRICCKNLTVQGRNMTSSTSCIPVPRGVKYREAA